MLKNMPWVRYETGLGIEFEQCLMEGRDVEKYRPVVESVLNLGSDFIAEHKDIVISIGELLTSSPIRADYAFIEPNDLDEILASSPSGGKHERGEYPTGDELLEKLRGAWIGRIAGCLLGKPVEGWRRNLMYPVLKATGNYPLARYIRQCEFSDELVKQYGLNRGACFADNVHHASPPDDDTNYTVFGLKLVSTFGRHFTSDNVMESWLSWIPFMPVCTAERAAYRNAACGMLPPETASYHNPYREWIGAQIRGDFFGYINPGNPVEAAKMAYRDACISQVKNGIYGEMFAAAMIAEAAVTDDRERIIEAGLSVIPVKSRMTRDVRKVIDLWKAGKTADEIMEVIHTDYNEHTENGWCYTNSNAMVVAMAILCGDGDYSKSICLAVQACFDTDCNGATVGSVIGMMVGEGGIASEWTEPFERKLMTTIEGYNLVDADELAEMTAKLVK